MRVSILCATFAAASLTSARLTGLAAPRTLAPSQPFTLILLTENYIQAVADISIAWGYALPPSYPFTLGKPNDSAYLGPGKSNQLHNVTVETTAPKELEQWKGKEVLLAGSLFSLYGVSGMPSVTNFNVTVTVGEETSKELVRSEGFTSGTA